MKTTFRWDAESAFISVYLHLPCIILKNKIRVERISFGKENELQSSTLHTTLLWCDLQFLNFMVIFGGTFIFLWLFFLWTVLIFQIKTRKDSLIWSACINLLSASQDVSYSRRGHSSAAFFLLRAFFQGCKASIPHGGSSLLWGTLSCLMKLFTSLHSCELWDSK